MGHFERATLINMVAPDTDLAGYPTNIFTGYPAGYPAK